MKKIFWFIFTVASLGCSTLSANSSKEMQLKPFQEITLSNGLKVLILEDKTLPYFSMTMLIKAGSYLDPQNQKGLAGFTGEMLSQGSSKRDTMQIAGSFEDLGSTLKVDVRNDLTLITASSLASGRDTLIKDFSEVVIDPIFPEKEITRMRQESLANFEQLPDDSDGFAGWAFNTSLYGANHPYGVSSLGTPKGIASIKRQDLQKFYGQYFRPNNAMLAVMGQMPANIQAQLEAAFGHWKNQVVTDVQIAKFPEFKGIDIELVTKPGLNQSQILFGQKGIQRSNPDFLPLRLASLVLGGGFTSRLVKEIRVKRGLTYSIFSMFDPRLGEGPFIISTFSRNDKVGETISETLKVLKQFQETGITEQELKDAKAYMKGQFPNALETPENLAQNLLVLRLYGIDDTYLTNYNANMDKITLEEVNRAIKQYISPDNMKILVYSTKDVLKQLEPIGKVKTIEFNQLL